MSWAVLENLTAGASVRGLTASGFAMVESVQWIGQQAVKVIPCDGAGQPQFDCSEEKKTCRVLNPGLPAWSTVVDDLLRLRTGQDSGGPAGRQSADCDLRRGYAC